MAVLQGISGMNIGDGAGGNIALSIQERVLRILADSQLSYLAATMRNPQSVKAGTATYYVPEIIGANDYGVSGSAFVTPQSGLVSFNLDTRRDVKHEYETFDVERIDQSDYIIGMISIGIAMAIQADLNGQFLTYLKKQFDAGGALAAQKVVTKYIGTKNATMTKEQAREDYINLQYTIVDLMTTFDKNKLGVNKSEFITILAPLADVNLKNAFWDQPNETGNFVISETLSGKKLGIINYIVDSMLLKNIPAGSSFNNNQAVDMSAYVGFILHNEAIAFPINLYQIINTINPDNGNPRYIAKYQFGIGTLRPKLVYAITKAATK